MYTALILLCYIFTGEAMQCQVILKKIASVQAKCIFSKKCFVLCFCNCFFHCLFCFRFTFLSSHCVGSGSEMIMFNMTETVKEQVHDIFHQSLSYTAPTHRLALGNFRHVSSRR